MREHAMAPEVAAGARYCSHGFLKKQEGRPLQAADLLAWHYGNDWTRKMRRETSRESFANLVMNAPLEKYWHFVWTRTKLRRKAKKMERLIRKYPDAGRELFGDENV